MELSRTLSGRLDGLQLGHKYVERRSYPTAESIDVAHRDIVKLGIRPTQAASHSGSGDMIPPDPTKTIRWYGTGLDGFSSARTMRLRA